MIVWESASRLAMCAFNFASHIGLNSLTKWSFAASASVCIFRSTSSCSFCATALRFSAALAFPASRRRNQAA